MTRPATWATGLVVAVMLAGVPAAPAWSSDPGARGASSIPADPAGDAVAVSVPYARKVPSFPRRVDQYVTRGKPKRSTVRLFKGGGWSALPPVTVGLAGNCEIAYWIVRWRSGNPSVLIDASTGTTPGDEFFRLTRPSRGGAGYAMGNACVVPRLRFAGNEPGNTAGLVDVYYEVQIWSHRPDI